MADENAGTIGVLAGSGDLPLILKRHLQAAGRDVIVLAIEGEADRDFGDVPVFRAPIEDLRTLADVLHQQKVTQIVLGGGVVRRPRWQAIRLPLKLMPVLPRAIRALVAGDDALLQTAHRALERLGVELVSIQAVMPELIAPSGRIGQLSPVKADHDAIAAGYRAAKELGRLDIGQAVVVFGTRAVAVEGIEGTEGMLERVRDLRDHGRIAGARRGVLVKCAKPGQDIRSDLPAIGPETIRQAAAAGLSGVAIEAGRSLILNLEDTLKAAEAADLYLWGIDGGEE
ncbi:LpxI family protein [Notoacmeibacter sp. MSK16QG-6]|uniref:LpxI family protein n=1 Tax=Notoacmeibacter sp. MSK16QG-6 TaxID=2957982 RepID=UPI00209E0097|nr:UDP-2,3-diacylglucosamine diphosphatase LpxI [Notoacmeibacter sp. MSK16QG-6]MCP1199341.1 UDP-2,3-diacylglucosamine diphosphatase LpxI [Notoacmeibacter sp. MSK16QG-6]